MFQNFNCDFWRIYRELIYIEYDQLIDIKWFRSLFVGGSGIGKAACETRTKCAFFQPLERRNLMLFQVGRSRVQVLEGSIGRAISPVENPKSSSHNKSPGFWKRSALLEGASMEARGGLGYRRGLVKSGGRGK